MGRKTFDSIGRALPGRLNIIITRDPEYKMAGVEVAHSLEEALEIASSANKEEIFIIGGGQIFKEAINLADKLYLTLVARDYNCDTFFPEYPDFKKIILNQDMETEGYKYKFLTLEK